MNNKTPKSMRLHIGIFGRTNVGKSSILNMITGQDISIISEIPGTTTDAVEKTMELLPVGPVVFIDTAGIDDKSELGNLRTNRTSKIFDKTDVAIVILEPDKWTDWEQKIFKICQSKKIEIIPLINKTDLITSSENFILKIKALGLNPLFCSAVKMEKRNETINEIKKRLLQISEKKKSPSSIMGDLLKKNGLAVLIVPIDKEAPKGRLILPQVQTIRDLLDNGALSLVTREKEYLRSLKN